MRRFFRWIVFLGLVGLAVFWGVTRPTRIDPDNLVGLTPDVARGERVFYAGGCASCHAGPDASAEEKLVLAGGRAFPSPFGTFYAPNISPSATGLAGWTDEDLANAMLHGTSPDGSHYFPAFPYTSYARATLQDIVDLKAFLDTLPVSDAENLAHDVPFPFNIRRSLGGWKMLFASANPRIDVGDDPQLRLGQYLVEGLGHCSECHTSRNFLGGIISDRWLAGGPNPDGKGRIPNITPHETGLTWSNSDIEEYLSSGFTPEFDVAGGQMADVVQNTGKLTREDRAAMAAYLKAVPALETRK